MTISFEDRLDEACAWAARATSDDIDWDAFTAWLEADAENVRAYEVVSGVEADIVSHAPAIRAAVAPSPPKFLPRRWLPAAGFALAASLAALIAIPALQTSQDFTSYSSGDAGGQSIALNSRTRVRLDAGTTIRVSPDASRIEIAAGAAYFDVAHDAGRPLVVVAGGYEVRDLGTKFDVATDADHLTVSVAEGRVDIAEADSSQRIPIAAGQRVDIEPRTRQAERMAVQPADVAAWREGQLRYQDVPLSLVAADISRYAGRRVTADPRVAAMRFSGVLEIGDGSRLVERVQQLLPVESTMVGSSVRLVPRRRH